MRRILPVVAGAMAIAALPAVVAAHGHATAQTARGHITLYTIPCCDPVAAGITAGPDGAMWYADFGDNSIGRITMKGKITEFPDGLSGPNGIVTGPDGDLWFTETTSQTIGRMTASGTITHFGHGLNFPQQITNGPDGALWFTAFGTASRITTDGVITTFHIGPSRTEFEGIATGSDGALWIARFLDHGGRDSDEIVRLTTRGSAKRYTVGSGPYGVTAGPDGAIWFTETGAGAIGRLTIDGHLTQYPLNSGLVPGGIAPGPDGALWFTVGQSSSFIGRITVHGHVTLYSVPGECNNTNAIAAGPDGAMWFTCGQSIGRITTR